MEKPTIRENVITCTLLRVKVCFDDNEIDYFDPEFQMHYAESRPYT